MSEQRSRTVLVVGPGWLGGPAAQALAARGDRVWVLQRSAKPAPPGCHGITGSVDALPDVPVLPSQMPPRIDVLLLAVAPSRARGDSYAMYPVTAHGAVRLAVRCGVTQLVQISSTGVYNRHDGADVSETTPLIPGDARVQALQDAESIIQAHAGAACTVTTLRPAGLYGPERDPAPRFQQPHPSPTRWCNFSWRADVVSAITHVLDLPPSKVARVFNCTDNVPVQGGAIVQALTALAPSHETRDEDPRSSRSHQRVSSAALMATGWQPTVPDIFAGLRQLGHALPGLDDTP